MTASAIYLSETLPHEKVASHGYAINFGVTLGITVTILAGSFVEPTENQFSWLYVALILPTLDIIVILVWLFWFKYESIGFCIKQEQLLNYKEQAQFGIKALYIVGDDMQKVSEVYENLKQSKDSSSDII